MCRNLRHVNLSSCLDVKKDATSVVFLTPIESGRSLHDMIFDENDVSEITFLLVNDWLYFSLAHEIDHSKCANVQTFSLIQRAKRAD